VRVNPLDTAAGRRVRELLGAGVAVPARPLLDFRNPLARFVIRARAVRVRQAIFAYLLLKPTDREEGLSFLEFLEHFDPLTGEYTPPEQRKVIAWL